jgi:hypothetical protein
MEFKSGGSDDEYIEGGEYSDGGDGDGGGGDGAGGNGNGGGVGGGGGGVSGGIKCMHDARPGYIYIPMNCTLYVLRSRLIGRTVRR